MNSRRTNSSTSIRAIVGHVLTKVQVFGLVFIVVVVFTTLLLILRSTNATTCRVIENELSGISGPLSREIALGDERTTNALFSQFTGRLTGLGASEDVSLERASFDQKTGGISLEPACKAGIFGAEILSPVNFGGKRVATIRGSVAQVSVVRVLSVLLFIFFTFVLLIRVFARRIELRLRKFVIEPVLSICGSRTLSSNEVFPDEVREIEQNINQLKMDIKAKERQNFELQRSKELGDLAAEVAHDILTPLSALTRLVQIAELPEDQKRLLRGASERINDIANSLLYTNRKTKEPAHEVTFSASEVESDLRAIAPHLLTYLADPVVSEKRVQLSSNLGLKIQTNLPCSYGLFARVEPIRFKRVISNLLNNAVEAIDESGDIELNISSNDQFVCFSIRDTGKGIPEEIIPQLTKRGFSFGKSQGSGLGLYQAKIALEQWGGSLEILSEVGKGTTVNLKIPRANEPSWFVPKIILPTTGIVCILDDDESIHHIWEQRIEEASVSSESKPKIMNFASAYELTLWQSGLSKDEEVFYLIDYELKGQDWTGLDVIRKLGIAERSVLVTSRFEEVTGIQTFKDLDLRLLPKIFLSAIPIELGTPESREVDCVLIDNDPLVHLTWSDSASRNGKRLRMLFSPDPFFDLAPTLRRNIPIFVDSDLGNGLKGEEVVQRIQALGFTNVLMETGYSPEHFERSPWITRVIGKDPPWDSPALAAELL